jgi:bis(5'-adenosyl)-triphosphatase
MVIERIYPFGSFAIPASHVFFTSKLTFAIVNTKPIVPGHVVVISRRMVPRLTELNVEEVSDLFHSVQLIGRIIEKVFKGEALTIALQDGAAAGQTVPVSRHPRLETFHAWTLILLITLACSCPYSSEEIGRLCT